MTPPTRRYDVIVIGIGGMGSAAVWHLAKRGVQVLGLEQFDIPHMMGSSHGITRIIRLAYFEHPSYVPLLYRAFDLWRELQRVAGEELLCVTGSVDVGRADSPVFAGSLQSCRQHGLTHEVLDRAALSMRFPAWSLPPGFQAVLQPDGGFLIPERCIVAHVFQAIERGADIRAREQVLQWEPTSQGTVHVTTRRGEYVANHLIVTAGPWVAKLIPALAKHAVVERQVLGWFRPKNSKVFEIGRFPVFNLRVDEGHFYGFPIYGIPGFKIGRYHHREETVDPDDFDREPNVADEAVLRECVEKYFPDAAGPVMSLKTCMFTNSPDEHFIVDRHPDFPQVTVAAGFSGHGFKFASVVGEIVADLALQGRTDHDVELFRWSRLSA